MIGNSTTDAVSNLINSSLHHIGFEVHFFKIQWYNECVSSPFQLNYNDDTLCAVVLTLPAFFEKAFLPFLILESECKNNNNIAKDAIDRCISYYLEQCTGLLNKSLGIKTHVMCDYEMLPNRRPKVLVQTAAHVSGAAFYYQRKHVEDMSCFTHSLVEETEQTTSWKDKKLFGVCIHPRYGGWFAIRSVLIFTNHLDSTLKKSHPVDCVPSLVERFKLLCLFNGNWQDGKYRDIINVKARYSEIQKKYFNTLPKYRHLLIPELLSIANDNAPV